MSIRKVPFKTLSTAAMVVTLLTSGVIAPAASAEVHTPVTQQVESTQKAVKNLEEIKATNLETNLKATNQHAMMIDAYALAVTKSPELQLDGSGLPAEHAAQIKAADIAKINSDMNSAKKNANNWIDNIRPKTQRLNENVSKFSIQYTSYIPLLLQYLEEDKRDKLAERLTKLANEAKKYQQDTEATVKTLQEFRTNIATDAGNYQRNSDTVLSYLTGSNTGIKNLVEQINANEEARKQAIGMISGGAVMTLLGIGTVVVGSLMIAGTLGGGTPFGVAAVAGGVGLTGAGGALMGTGVKNLNETSNALVQLTQQKAAWELHVVNLTHTQKSLITLKEKADQAVTAAQNLASQWGSLGLKLDTLADFVKNVEHTEEDKDLIKAQISMTETSWKDVKTVADSLNMIDIQK
ncbi:HBL/NHE enterotoxin family protein [Bacillus cereus]|uniref:Alpha-helical pore-forming toxin family protein n=1 Tax=Bacillus cereus TaxID=1396 RepID=A0AAW5L4C7_BACCE|nr:HBL/NHE enterotoxin family protein [Bacillus cereus]MCQ6289117.1 alpha-helical pore-forming toxin family protein [Bacillus cereus]MCQ6318596.1 alpha-helical pore-forming toxin family protein [Bacillus cereus]MCQ6330978.1 alpha-helical pore-forming toxin family protein [Bacillus cereus]MCQ6386153.1 alpha-helical pore-forming toxin family protein [Bacillus cereus]